MDAAVLNLAQRLTLPEALALADFCNERHIRRLSLFGSVLRDDFRPDSDLDILVEYDPGQAPGFAFVDHQSDLSALFHRNVDLHTAQSLSPSIRRAVLLEALTLHEST
ncbi:MAG: nucleotidyltransferase domain-containing protein [Bryobacterales bacterium]